jgi:hypothetical protein
MVVSTKLSTKKNAVNKSYRVPKSTSGWGDCYPKLLNIFIYIVQIKQNLILNNKGRMIIYVYVINLSYLEFEK